MDLIGLKTKQNKQKELLISTTTTSSSPYTLHLLSQLVFAYRTVPQSVLLWTLVLKDVNTHSREIGSLCQTSLGMGSPLKDYMAYFLKVLRGPSVKKPA